MRVGAELETLPRFRKQNLPRIKGKLHPSFESEILPPFARRICPCIRFGAIEEIKIYFFDEAFWFVLLKKSFGVIIKTYHHRPFPFPLMMLMKTSPIRH